MAAVIGTLPPKASRSAAHQVFVAAGLFLLTVPAEAPDDLE